VSLEELDRLDLTFIEVMPLGEGKEARRLAAMTPEHFEAALAKGTAAAIRPAPRFPRFPLFNATRGAGTTASPSLSNRPGDLGPCQLESCRARASGRTL
jgi:hypothetical protein